jgi:hypothetical protein
MYLDKQLIMSDAQAITEAAVSTNVLEIGTDNAYENAWVVVRVQTAFDTGAVTLTVNLETDDVEAFTGTGSTKRTLISTGAIAAAKLTAGKVLIKERLPIDRDKYLRVSYTPLDASGDADTFGAGAVDAFITLDTEIE